MTRPLSRMAFNRATAPGEGGSDNRMSLKETSDAPGTPLPKPNATLGRPSFKLVRARYAMFPAVGGATRLNATNQGHPRPL